MWNTFPLFGSTLLLCVMVVASYTFGVSVVAGANGKPRTLQAARFGAYGTVALIASCVLCLAYAFVSHDFRLRYVAHYSDRSMPHPLPAHLALGRARRIAPVVAVPSFDLHLGVRQMAWKEAPSAPAVHHRHLDGGRPVLLRAHGVRRQSVLDERRRRAS